MPYQKNDQNSPNCILWAPRRTTVLTSTPNEVFSFPETIRHLSAEAAENCRYHRRSTYSLRGHAAGWASALFVLLLFRTYVRLRLFVPTPLVKAGRAPSLALIAAAPVAVTWSLLENGYRVEVLSLELVCCPFCLAFVGR